MSSGDPQPHTLLSPNVSKELSACLVARGSRGHHQTHNHTSQQQHSGGKPPRRNPGKVPRKDIASFRRLLLDSDKPSPCPPVLLARRCDPQAHQTEWPFDVSAARLYQRTSPASHVV